MIFTWKIQLIDHFPDEYDEKGAIGLENALLEFQNFPWEEQLMMSKDRIQTSCSPTICFNNSNGDELLIWSSSLDNFELSYSNQTHQAHLILSNDFMINPKSLGVEDYIKSFFNGEIDFVIQVEKKEDASNLRDITSPLLFSENRNRSFRFIRAATILFTIHLITLLGLYNGSPEIFQGTSFLIFQAVLFLIYIPRIILFTTYYYKNYKAKLVVDPTKKIIIYQDRKRRILFSREDIKFALWNMTKDNDNLWPNLNYLRIDLNNGESVWITCLITDIDELINTINIHYSSCSSYFPTL